jgi:hypothetical protein
MLNNVLLFAVGRFKRCPARLQQMPATMIFQPSAAAFLVLRRARNSEDVTG